MLTQVDIKKLPSYSIGFEDGEADGEAKAQAQIVRRLLARIDAAEVGRLLGLSPEEVERIAGPGGDTVPD